MEELDRADRSQVSSHEGDVLVLEMPDGERRRFPIIADGGKHLLAAWDALPEECRQKNMERTHAELDGNTEPLRVVYQSGGRVILVGPARSQDQSMSDD